MNLHNFNSNTKSWKMYTNTLTSISGDDLLVMPSYGKDIILEVSANNDIFFKKGTITKRFDNLVSDYLETSFNSLNSQVQYILQEISGNSVKDFITSGISNDLLIKSYDGRDIILEVSGNSEIIFKRGDFSYNLDDLIGGGGSSSNIVLTSISGDIIPSINNTFKLGDISKNWSNAYIRDISVTNINGQPYINNATYLIDYSNSSFSPLGQDLSGEPTDGQAIISYFGFSVALSQDGTIMGVTAPLNNGTGAVQGSARIYKYNDVSWVQLGQDIDGEANNDLQANIKLSNDGTIAALGSWYNSGIGSIRVFKYNDISWIQLGQDIDGTAADDEFGFSISLSGNGKIIAIGAPSNDTSYNQAGQVRVYSYIENDNSWNIIGTFNGFGFNNRSGISVSLSSSGTILAISSPFLYNSDNLADMPRVDIYEFSNNVWSPKGPTIYGSYLGEYSKFGNNIELSKDGLILTINELYNPSNNNLGRVLTYKYNSTDNSWNKLDSTINIVVDSSNSDWEDPYIALSSDGTIMALGMAHSNSTNRGLVRLYKLINNEWIKVGPDILSDASEGLFGYGLSLSSDGSILAIGSPQEGLSSEGYVRVYKVDYSYNNVIQYYQFTNIKANNIEIIGNIVGNIVPLNATSSTLGTSIKYWSNAYINDISTTNIEVSGNIVPLNANSSTLGTSIKYWSNAYIIDVSVSNISVSDNIILNNIILNICGGTITNINKLTAPASNYKITSTTRLYQEISGDISWNTVNGYYGLAKDAYPSLNPYSSGVKAVQNWTGRGQGIELNFWQSVCWSPELRIFVAVAITGDNRVMTSAEGTSWTSVSDGVELNEWTSICWSPELEIFVAVAISGDNRVMTSSYGTSWTSSSEGVELNYWSDLCWSPQLRIFVAVAINGDNRVMTSSNGTSWTTTSEGVELISWSSVCWSAELGIFVAVASSGDNRVMTSSNGTSWTSSSEGVDLNEWTSVCWSPEFGIFVAVASSGDNRVMTSANGTSWTPILGGIENVSQGVEFNSWQSVCWSAELGIFIAVARTENYRVMYSANGTSWLSFGAYDIELNDWTSVCWSPELGIFVAVAISGDNRVMTSSLKGRPPTSYNVFDSTSNSIDENGTWTFSNISILENIVPVSDNYSNLGLDTHKWASAHIASLNTNSISILENIVPINDNYSNLGLDTNRWNNAHIASLNTNSISILENIVPVNDNYSNLGLDTHKWASAHIASLNTNSISIVDNLVPVNDNYSNLGLDTNRWNNAYINALNVTETVTFGGSNLYVPSSFTIDPLGHGDNTGTVTINGNLVVQGVTTTINSSVVDISDKMLVLASKASNSLQADGAGFEISGAKVNFLYNNSSASFRSSIGISISGNVVPVTSTGSLGSSLIPWSNAYIRDISTTNIEVSGNIVPLRDMSSNLGSSLKRWKNVFVNDLSVNTINGQAYSAGGGTSGSSVVLTSISGNIIPSVANTSNLGSTTKPWSNAYISNIDGETLNARHFTQRFSNNLWNQLGRDISNIVPVNNKDVAISNDGKVVAMSSSTFDLSNATDVGIVYVYEISYNEISYNWLSLGNTIVGVSGDELGYSLALSSNGKIVAASSLYNDSSGNNSGQVKVFELSNNLWSPRGNVINGKPIINYQSGYSINLSGNGNIISISSFKGSSDLSYGEVRVYELSTNNIWIQKGSDICGTVIGESHGFSSSLSLDGLTLALGSNVGFNNNIGKVNVYRFTTNWNNIGTISGPQLYLANNDNYSYTQLGPIIGRQFYDPSYLITVNTTEQNIALNGDGTIFVHSMTDSYGLIRAFKYRTSDASWIQLGQTLRGSSVAGNIQYIGTTYGTGFMNISNDGYRISIGMNFDNASQIRGARIYSYNGSSWSIIGDISGTENGITLIGDRHIHALSGDGNTIALYTHYTSYVNQASNQMGQIRVYRYQGSGTNWTRLGNDISGTSTPAVMIGLGQGLAISSDGNTILATTRTYPGGSGYQGIARVFKYSDFTNTWNIIGEFYGPGTDVNTWKEFGYGYGASVISGDGQTVAVTTYNSGIYIFKYNSVSGTWQSAIVALNKVHSYIKLSYDGNTLVTNNQERYIYRLSVWKLLTNSTYTIIAGSYIKKPSLSGDGRTFVHSYLDPTTNNGACQVYKINTYYSGSEYSENLTYSTNKASYINLFFGRDIKLSSDGNEILIGATGPIINGLDPTLNNTYLYNQGSIYTYMYTGSGTTWTQLGQIIHGISGSDEFGSNVSMSNDGSTISAGSNNNDSNRGIVRVYKYYNDGWYQLGNNLTGKTTISKAGFSALSGDGTTLIQSNNTYNTVYGINNILSFTSPNVTISGDLVVTSKAIVNNLIINNNIDVSANLNPTTANSGNLGTAIKPWGNANIRDLSVNTINGASYNSSFTNIKMLICGPTSADYTLDTAVGNGGARGFYGLFTDGRYAYLVPYQNPGQSGLIARVDLNNWTTSGVSYLDVTTGNSLAKGFNGGFTDGRYGYLIPFQNAWPGNYMGIVVRFDLQNFTSTGVSYLNVAVGNGGAIGFASGFTDGRYGYLVPNINGIFTRIDLLNFTSTGVSYLNVTTINTSFWGGFVYGNFGYLVPSATTGMFVRIDLLNFTLMGVSSLNVALGNTLAKGFRGGFTDGRYGYLVPLGDTFHGIFTRVDLQNFTQTGVSYIDLKVTNSLAKGYWGGFTDGRYGYLVPYSNDSGGHGLFARVDLQNFTSSGVTILNVATINANARAFGEGFTDGKYAYFSPYGNGFYNSTFTRVNISNINNSYNRF